MEWFTRSEPGPNEGDGGDDEDDDGDDEDDDDDEDEEGDDARLRTELSDDEREFLDK